MSSPVTHSRSRAGNAPPSNSASSVLIFCFPTYTFFPSASAASKKTRSFPMVYVPNKNNVRPAFADASAVAASRTDASTEACVGNACFGSQYVVSSMRAGERAAAQRR